MPDVLAELWRAYWGTDPTPEDYNPSKYPAPPTVAYHCRRCDVGERVERTGTLHCWVCGRFVKSNTYGISLANGGAGATYESLN